MATLTVRIDGIIHGAPGSGRRMRRRSPRRVLAVMAAVLAGALIVQRVGLTVPPRRVAEVHSTPVRADNVLVLIDVSTSMAGTEPEVARQLAALRAAGIAVAERVDVPGWAISSTSRFSLVPAAVDRLRARPHVDAVYVISDFAVRDDEANDAAAAARLTAALGDSRRIYWSTVRAPLPPAYVALARQTDGGIISTR